MKLSGICLSAALAIIVIIGAGCSDSKVKLSLASVPDLADMKQVELFSQMADEVYEKTIKGAFPEARQQIILMGNMVPKMRLDGVTSLEGIQALANTLVQATTVFNAVRLNPDDALLAAAKIRLMADALTHPNTPMWIQYNKVIQEDLNNLERAIKQKQAKAAQNSFIELKNHYETIRPALKVSRNNTSVAMIDSALSFLQSGLKKTPIEYVNLSSTLKQARESLERLFQNKTDETAYLPIILTDEPILIWSLCLGALIILTLAFVAWRKLQARHDIVPMRRKADGE
jgi:sporulation protein YpjB